MAQDDNPFTMDLDDLDEMDLQPMSPLEPSSDVTGSLGGDDGKVEDDEASLLESGEVKGDKPLAVGKGPGMCGCFTLAYYKQFFNVDTQDVKARLFRAVVPMKDDFIDVVQARPDLYGPFWITTTLIFLIGMSSNLASWLAFVKTTEKPAWQYDFTLVTLSTTLIYGYALVLPVAVWFLFKYWQIPIALLSLLCLYGYSMTVLVPTALLCIIPVSALAWIFIILAWAVSSVFLCRNLWKRVKEHAPKQSMIVMGVLVVCHAGLMICLKLFFFAHGGATDDAGATDVTTLAPAVSPSDAATTTAKP